MCQSLNNCIFKSPQWYTFIAPEMRALYIWFMRERNVTMAICCVVMRNVACISASCIFKIPRRLLWWDSLWYTSATQDNSLWSLNHYEERTNLPPLRLLQYRRMKMAKNGECFPHFPTIPARGKRNVTQTRTSHYSLTWPVSSSLLTNQEPVMWLLTNKRTVSSSVSSVQVFISAFLRWL